MMKFIYISLFTIGFTMSQTEYKYNLNDTIPEWVQEMYSNEPNPGKVENLYKNYYLKNNFIKNKHTQYYKRWRRSLSRNIGSDLKYKNTNLDLPEWRPIGPFDFDRNAASSSYAAGAAHLYTVEQSVSNTDILYAGAATSGLWKSIDKGLHWFSLFDKDLFINEVYSLEIDFLNSDNIYFSSGSSLYYSSNGGVSCSLIFELGFIKDIVFCPSNNNILYICSSEGLHQLNIEDNTIVNLLDGDILEIEFNPINNNVIYTVRQVDNKTEFLKSTDNGEVFINFNNGWPSPILPNEQKRTEIAVSMDNPDRIVALCTGSVNNGSGLYGLYVSDDQGENWEFRCCGNQEGGEPSEENVNLMGWSHEGLDDGGQYYYDLALALNPNDADIIHVGGVNHWVSNDGGYSFVCPSKWSWADDSQNTKYVHADIHDIKYYDNDLWIACDGGLFYSNNQADTIHQRMFGISGTDFWGFGTGFNNGDVMIGGTYHNATLLKDNDTYIQGDTLSQTEELGGWASICGGDNFRGFVNFGDGRKVYLDEWGSGGGYILSGNRDVPLQGFSMSVLSNASYTTGESSNLEFDPRCYNIIYIGNGDVLYKSFDNGYTSMPLYDFEESVTSIEVSWSSPNVIYVATYDGYWSDKHVWKSEDYGVTFIDITPTFPGILLDPWIPFDITVSSINSDELWIARCPNSTGYNSYDNNKVYKSIDGGSNWINITYTGLGGEDITNIEHQRGSEGGVYVGTRKSVYYKNNNMNEWVLFNNQLPLSTYSTQLVPYYKESKLRNGTNRSVWEVSLFEQSAPSSQISADKLIINCLNDTVYFIDHSAISNDNASWSWSFPGGSPSESTEQNPVVVYAEVGVYEVSLTVTDDYGTDSQVITNMITYTNDPLSMEGFDCDGICQEGFMNVTLIAMDSYGDGWNGNSLSIIVDGVLLNQNTLPSGNYNEFNLCIPSNQNTCVEILVEEGGWPEEVSWDIIDNNNNIIISGGSPFYDDIYGSCPVYGCTNIEAVNYNSNANTDDGSCCLGNFYNIILEDSYGDGWNGNTLIIGDYILDFEDGYEIEEVICLNNGLSCIDIVCDGGEWQEEISWSIYDASGLILVSGGSPYEGCFLEGCSDPTACNYNIEVTNDNGSCIYPDSNGDCNSILVEEFDLSDLKNRVLTDVIGREIKHIKTNQIYLFKDRYGEVKKNIIFK